MKLPVYRAAGVREIWFVDLWNDRIEIHRFPAKEGTASVITLGREDVLTTPSLPGLGIPVADVLV